MKVVHRAHFTKARLAKIYPNANPLCPRCSGQPADLMDMFWRCPNLSTFLLSIFKAFSEMFGTQLDPDPICALFGLTPGETQIVLPAKAQVVIAFTTLHARRLILFRWKQQAPLSFSHWVNDVMYFLKLEKIKYSSKDPFNLFSKYGGPFSTFMTSFRSPLTMNKVELIHD